MIKRTTKEAKEIEKLKKILHELVYEKLEIKPTDEKVTKLNEIYTRLLRREIDVGGLLNFYPKIKNNEMSFDELEEHIRNSNEFIVTEKSPTSKTEFNYYSPDMKN